MPFSVFPWIPIVKRFSLWNGKILRLGEKTQYTWTVLPQGFKNSLTVFGNQLARELGIWKKENNQEILLKYMDDLLIVAETEEQRTKLTIHFLNFWGISGYRVSKEKNQITQKEETYLNEF